MAKKHQHNRIRSREFMRPETLLSVVIPVYGRFDLLDQCLKALPEACGDITYSVILVDNASPDPGDFYKGKIGLKIPPSQMSSVVCVPDHAQKNISVIQNEQNLGFPRACNIGARHSRAPLILFLNTDVIMQPGSISNMVRLMDVPDIGVVGAKLLFPEGNQWQKAGTVQHVGLASDIHGEFYHQFLGWSPDNPKVKSVEQVLAVTGAAMMVRRGDFHKWGGFAEVYGMGTYEDVDLCLTAGANKYRIFICQEAVGYHFTGATSSAYGAHFPIYQNRSIFMSRWMNRFPWSEWQYA